MQTTQAPLRPVVLPKFNPAKQAAKAPVAAGIPMSNYIADEINAYAAIRDIALAEAESETTPVNLQRVRIANDFVENALRSASAPYERQHLPESDAARERGRCQAVKVRLALLQSHMTAVAREHVRAA